MPVELGAAALPGLSVAAAIPKLDADITRKPPAAILAAGRTCGKRMKCLPCCCLLLRNRYSTTASVSDVKRQFRAARPLLDTKPGGRLNLTAT